MRATTHVALALLVVGLSSGLFGAPWIPLLGVRAASANLVDMDAGTDSEIVEDPDPGDAGTDPDSDDMDVDDMDVDIDEMDIEDSAPDVILPDIGGTDTGSDTFIDVPVTDTGGTDTGGTDTGTPDAGSDTATDTGTPDTGSDTGTPDTGSDTGTPDTGSDTGTPDAGTDTGGTDTGPPDVGSDSGSDTSTDTGSDTTDTASDTSADTGSDTATDSSADTAADSGADPPVDAGSDTPTDSASDTTNDTTTDTTADTSTDPTDTDLSSDGPSDSDVSTDASDASDMDAEEAPECTEYPDFSVSASQSISFNPNAPRILGTGVVLDVSASIGVSAGLEDGECSVGLEASGSIEGCGSILSQEVCVTGSVSGSGSCTAPQECLEENAPLYTCDVENYCCSGDASASIGVERRWSPMRRFGPFHCGFDIGASVTGSISASAEFGPYCDCDGRVEAEPRITLAGDGGASCGITIWGVGLSAGASASACANAGVNGGYGCELSISPVGGASFTIGIDPVTVGWVTVGGYNRTWSTGSGCP